MTNRTISDRNYEHVLNVQKTSKTNTIKDYHDLNLKVNVLLLSCMFETIRRESINSFELNPAHYFLFLVIVGLQC